MIKAKLKRREKTILNILWIFFIENKTVNVQKGYETNTYPY